MFSPDQLSDDPEELKKIILKIVEQNKENKETLQKRELEVNNLKTENDRLRELVRFFKRREFGSSSEIVSSEQLGLFNEVEEIIKTEEENSVSIPGHERKKPGRKPLPEDLPRIQKIIDLPEEEKVCSCGCQKKKIGEEISKTLEIIPAQFRAVETIRYTYACPNENCDEKIKTAPHVPVPIPKSIASPSLLAYLIVSKFCDHLPFYRLSNILDRFGIEISRGTMASWMIKVSDLLIPLFNLLQERLLEGNYVGMDETSVQVLDEPGKTPQSKSYMWVFGRAGPPGNSIVLFEYDPTRKQDVPMKILQDYKGYLQSDGYAGYNAVSTAMWIIRIGCMAHVKRKFHDAWIEAEKRDGKAREALIFIKKLYKIEKSVRGKSVEEIYRERQKESKPLLDKFKLWIDATIDKVPSQNLLGKALSYAQNEWSYIIKYIEDGNLPIDNNFIENKIRPFALGRKNWLFSQSVSGAKASAILYSIVSTAQANGLEPYAYLSWVLAEIPKAKTVDDFEKLLPIAEKFKINTGLN